jgi:hypothetical protein
MSRSIPCLAAMLLSAACLSGQAGEPAQKAKKVTVGEDFTIAEAVQWKNLAVFPVLSVKPKDEDLYITLEEGLKSDKVEVYEVGAKPERHRHANRGQNVQRPVQQVQPQANNDPFDDGEGPAGDVNHLMVVNRSQRLLYLMPGEIIMGGKQDRCVAKECVIAADGKPVKIDVYCVEHGRWTNGQVFKEKAGNLGKAGRATVQEAEGSSAKQSQVWNSVAQSNTQSGVSPSTGAFTANYTDAKLAEKIAAYLRAIEQPVADHKQIVGVIVAINGKMEVIDVFGSTPLFRKVWPKMLSGYALDAAASAWSEKGSQPGATLSDAEKFFREATESGLQKMSLGGGGLVIAKRESDRVVSYSAAPSAKDAADKQSFGKGPHSAGYSK